jgi:acetyltransferase EpsM
MSKKKLLIFGAGNQSNVVTKLIEDKFNILGYVTSKNITKSMTNNKKIYSLTKNNLVKITENKSFFSIIAIGDNKTRKKIFNNIKKFNLKIKWLSIISPNSIISKDVIIGKGSLVMPGCIINNGTRIKDHCIINTGSIIEHDNYFDNFSSCGPGVVTGGNVRVGESSYIGIGSVVKEKIMIDDNVFIGGNSFINKNCKKNSLYYGNPIKLIS